MKNYLWYNFDVPDFDSSCCSTSARLIFFHTAGVITLRLGAQRGLKMAIQLLHARCGSQQKWQNIVPSEHVHDIFFTCPYVPYLSSRTKIADIYSILNNHPAISGPSAYDHSLLPNITDGPTPTAGAPLAAPVFFAAALHTGEVTGCLLEHGIKATQKAQHMPVPRCGKVEDSKGSNMGYMMYIYIVRDSQ